MSTPRLWILGAPDPEMVSIETILSTLGEVYAHAYADGKRCHGGNAYKATEIRGPGGELVFIDDFEGANFVECNVPIPDREGWPLWLETTTIDHHNPGDPGFDKGPADYWSASSIGQVCRILGIEPTNDLRLVAASDHCPGPAYRGACPGIEPNDLMAFRAKNAAAFRASKDGSDVGQMAARIVREIEDATVVLKESDTLDLRPWQDCAELYDCTEGRCSCPGRGHDPCEVVDLRDREIPSLPEAALRLGAGYITTVKERDDRYKVVLGGENAPETVRAFLDVFVPEHGLVEAYGVPARGYAGAYVPKEN